MPHGNSKKLAGVRFQNRDLAMLGELGQVVWMSTACIHRRHFPADNSGEATRRRLRTFVGHGLIESIELHLATRPQQGRLHRYHRLLPYGAEVLTDLTGVPPARLQRSSPAKPHKIQHRAGMGESILEFNDACRGRELPDPSWILEYDPIPNAPAKAPFHQRYLICDEVLDDAGQPRRVWPDAMSALTVPHKGSISQLALAWEFDRGTETLTQVREKLHPYLIWIAGKGYQAHFRDSRDVRVCFIAPSRRRMASMIKYVRDHRIGPFLRFVSVEDFKADRILTEPIWYDVTGHAKRILPS